MTTSKRQKLLPRFIVPLAFCAGISVWSVAADRGPMIGPFSLGEVLQAAQAAQAAVDVVDKSIRDYKRPAEIPWTERPNGSAGASLYGDTSKPGQMYVSLLRRPPNNWSEPHTHASERYVTVLEGTFLAGTGPVQDRNRVAALKPGTVVSEVPSRFHYDGVGADGVRLFFIGLGGPAPKITEAPRAPGGPAVDPTARIAKTVESMTWSKAADGSTFANVYGDPSKPGLYVQYVRRPANSWSVAHRHPNDQFVWVMSGLQYIGTGTAVDRDKTLGLPQMSFSHDKANGWHYEGTKDTESWILVAGMGPATPEIAAGSN